MIREKGGLILITIQATTIPLAASYVRNPNNRLSEGAKEDKSPKYQ